MEIMPSFRRLMISVLTIFLMISVVQAQSDGETIPDGMMTPQLNPYGGPDPWIQYYEGNYYLATTTGRSNLIMSMAPTLAGLKTAS